MATVQYFGLNVIASTLDITSYTNTQLLVSTGTVLSAHPYFDDLIIWWVSCACSGGLSM